jgi:uncharacterized membrane protein (UPF0127 family)
MPNNNESFKAFGIFWKTLLVIAVYFISFQSANILINTWQNFMASERLQNYIYGDKFFIIGDSKLKIILSDTEEKRIKGLSGMEKLDYGHAMLFAFDKKDYYGIWMKEMNFPIDIIWFDEKFEVVYFLEDVLPSSYPNIFKPKFPAKYILEVGSGFVRTAGIKNGDQGTFLD